MPYSVDFSDDPKYNRKVKVVYEKDRTIYKLSQNDVTIYIGEVKYDDVRNEVRDNGNEDKRSGETRRS